MPLLQKIRIFAETKCNNDFVFQHQSFFGERFLIAPQYRLLRYLLFALAIVLLSFWEVKDIYQEGSRWFPVAKSSIICLLVVYLNLYLLAPQFLLKRRWYWVYLLTTLYVALSVYFIEMWLNDAVYLKHSTKIMELYGKIEINPLLQVFTSVFSLIILMFSSSAIVLFRKWAIHDARVNDLEKNAIQSELEQLKKQVNPQFLIRLLDKANATSLQSNREEAAAILLRLGNILRYQLYDSTRQFVLLSSDIRFLTEILSLEQKCRDDFSFTVESDGNLHDCLIPPLLFLPFIEHVVSANRDVSFINLHFRMDDDTLVFECQTPANRTEENPDAGFEAIHRRLALLYGNAYSLEIKNRNGLKIIRLCISHSVNHPLSIAS
jgi:sensor histidine kinase YesM